MHPITHVNCYVKLILFEIKLDWSNLKVVQKWNWVVMGTVQSKMRTATIAWFWFGFSYREVFLLSSGTKCNDWTNQDSKRSISIQLCIQTLCWFFHFLARKSPFSSSLLLIFIFTAHDFILYHSNLFCYKKWLQTMIVLLTKFFCSFTSLYRRKALIQIENVPRHG